MLTLQPRWIYGERDNSIIHINLPSCYWFFDPQFMKPSMLNFIIINNSIYYSSLKHLITTNYYERRRVMDSDMNSTGIGKGQGKVPWGHFGSSGSLPTNRPNARLKGWAGPATSARQEEGWPVYKLFIHPGSSQSSVLQAASTVRSNPAFEQMCLPTRVGPQSQKPSILWNRSSLIPSCKRA